MEIKPRRIAKENKGMSLQNQRARAPQRRAEICVFHLVDHENLNKSFTGAGGKLVSPCWESLVFIKCAGILMTVRLRYLWGFSAATSSSAALATDGRRAQRAGPRRRGNRLHQPRMTCRGSGMSPAPSAARALLHSPAVTGLSPLGCFSGSEIS